MDSPANIFSVNRRPDPANIHRRRHPQRLRPKENRLTKYRELQHLRTSDLSVKVLDSLEDELPELNPEQKIKLLGVLTRSEAQYNKDKGQNKMMTIADYLINMEKNGRIEPENIEVENVVDYK